ncbi:MAG: glycoside hydrolase family protein [Lentisphaeria bacterium]|nr:glycoside hydrolase family protein [Lentisphaeria bacterium]
MKKSSILVLLMAIGTGTFAEKQPAFKSVDSSSTGLVRTQLPVSYRGKPTVDYTRMALNSTFAGTAISEPKMYNWGSSPLEDKGKIHLFHCRWPSSMMHWKTNAEIVHYVGDKPEGPFKIVKSIFNNENLKQYGYKSPVNPRLEKVDGKFAVFFTVQKINGKFTDQAIALGTADQLEGPWTFSGIVLQRITGNSPLTAHSSVGVSNPAFIKVGNKYHLYFKYKSKVHGKGGYGVAVANALEGPYVIKGKATENISYVEDAQAFKYHEKYYLLSCDNYGTNTNSTGAIILWESKDGLTFKRQDSKIAFGIVFDYCKQVKSEVLKKKPFIRHGSGKFERPAILFQNGEPTYFYGVGCINIDGGKTPESYVLKINK